MDYAKAIEEVGRQLGLASDKILPYYTTWYTVDAIVGVVVGSAIIAGSLLGMRKVYKCHFEGDDTDRFFKRLFLIIALSIPCIIGILVFCHDLPTLFAPEAKAFYKLISHIRGQ